MGVTGTQIPLSFFVGDIIEVVSQYNRLQVRRSTGNQDGPWEVIAGTSATSATMLGSNKGQPYALAGKTLILRFNSLTTIPITFAGLDPYTAAGAAAEISVALGVTGTAVDDGGYVRITSAATGTASSVEIYGGDAYANLGFQVDSFGLGTDAHLTLVGGTTDYSYTDDNGSHSYWYSSRYYNSDTGLATDWFSPFPANYVQKISSAALIAATCKLVDLKGNALVGQRIIISNVFEPSKYSSYGVFGLTETLSTNSEGEATIRLIRGSLVEVAFESTGVVRRIRVPTTGTSFDLLDGSLADDQFGIHVPVVRIAERRSP